MVNPNLGASDSRANSAETTTKVSDASIKIELAT